MMTTEPSCIAVDDLRIKTAEGKRMVYQQKRRKVEAERRRVEAERVARVQHDLQKAQTCINKIEKRLPDIADRGGNTCKVCILRRKIHFSQEFEIAYDPQYLGIIGKIIYEHFHERGFQIGFFPWTEFFVDPHVVNMGYEFNISW